MFKTVSFDMPDSGFLYVSTCIRQEIIRFSLPLLFLCICRAALPFLNQGTRASVDTLALLTDK